MVKLRLLDGVARATRYLNRHSKKKQDVIYVLLAATISYLGKINHFAGVADNQSVPNCYGCNRPPLIGGRMSFQDVVFECFQNRELVREFDRLRGTNVAMRGAPINLMIDKACGKDKADLKLFFAFVFECVWLPLVAGTE